MYMRTYIYGYANIDLNLYYHHDGFNNYNSLSDEFPISFYGRLPHLIMGARVCKVSEQNGQPTTPLQTPTSSYYNYPTTYNVKGY